MIPWRQGLALCAPAGATATAATSRPPTNAAAAMPLAKRAAIAKIIGLPQDVFSILMAQSQPLSAFRPEITVICALQRPAVAAAEYHHSAGAGIIAPDRASP